METQIKINGKVYTIRTKKDLFTPKFQEILEKSYKNKKKADNPNIEKIYCSCKRKKYDINVRLYTKKVGNKYTLSTYPDQAKEHAFDCPFNSEGIESFVKEEDGKIQLLSKNILFKTDTPRTEQIVKNQEGEDNNKTTERNVKGFNHLMFILINEAYSFAFNIKNRSLDRLSGQLQNITVEDFKRQFYRLFMNTKFKSGKTVRQVLKEENTKIFLGIIDKVDKNKNFYFYYSNGKKWKIPQNIWQKGTRFARIGKNYIPPPYFFVKLVKDNKTLRFFVMPVADSDIFIPVESGVERVFIINYLNKPVYKPLTVSHIKRILTKEPAAKFYSVVFPDTRPDFFIFEKNRIKVVEVVDKNSLQDEYYKDNLKKKENMYRRLASIFSYEKHIF